MDHNHRAESLTGPTGDLMSTNGQMDHSDSSWLRDVYFSSMTDKINASLDYLHSTITWSITVATAGVGLITAQATYPDMLSMLLSLLLLILLTHFFARAGKAYMNVVRYAAIQRRLTYWILSVATPDGEHQAVSDIRDCITYLDLEWRSPVRPATVLRKLLLECGFAYLYMGVFGLVCFTAVGINTLASYLAALAALLLIVLEVRYGLLRSPYLRATAIDALAEAYR